MLRFVRIRHLAVIDSVEVEFEPGLNVLTGETGAGKSILVEALGLLLGARASGDAVRTGEDLATVEAIFQTDEGDVLVGREISSQGRSRAYVDGALVTAAALRNLTAAHIELHGQHEHQTLLDPGSHRTILDTAAGLATLTASTGSSWERWRTAKEELRRARGAAATRGDRMDLIAYQLAEIDRVDPRPGEDEELVVTRQVLASAERVQRLCAEGYGALYEHDGAVLSALDGVWRRVAELATIDPRFQAHVDLRSSIKAQLEDLAMALRSYGDGVEASPARLQQVDDRLAALGRLKKKHGPSLGEVIARAQALRAERDGLAQSGEHLADLERAEGRARMAYLEDAGRLSAARQAGAIGLARALEEQLGELAMAGTRLDIRVGSLDEGEWGASGCDVVEFYVSPNPGEDLRPLARIASGGELSRVMLAIKTLTAGARGEDVGRRPGGAPPGLVFDEVDAGIGGRVADVVARKLRALGSAFQVLCITHLPQIAAAADAHFVIDKRVQRERTRAEVRRVRGAARVDELSRMLAGARVTDAVRTSAREMLASRGGPPDEGWGESESRRGAKAKAPRGRRPR